MNLTIWDGFDFTLGCLAALALIQIISDAAKATVVNLYNRKERKKDESP